MSGACRTHGKEEFWLENLEARDHLENLGVNGKIILEGILGK
jgi:hypothetical protein